MEEKFTHVGTFCFNRECENYGQVGLGNVVKYGKSAGGVQRYRCKTCGKTFTATKGTLFYKRQTPAAGILETLALLAEGVRIASLSRAKGFKEDTILSWLREAAKHAEAVEEALLSEYRVSRVQVDALWAYVGRKKGVLSMTPKRASSGVAP